MVTTNQKSTIDTHTHKRNPNTTLIIKSQVKRTKEERGELKRRIKTNPEQLTKWQ